VVLDPLADLITTRDLFDQFVEASKDFVPKKGWKGFVKIGQGVAVHQADYGQAKSKSAPASKESPAAKQHREAQERRKPKPWPTN
jgi:hypothetical protein